MMYGSYMGPWIDVWVNWVIYVRCMGQWGIVWSSGVMYGPVGLCMGDVCPRGVM